MRKIKKINGFLVVKFNDREKAYRTGAHTVAQNRFFLNLSHFCRIFQPF